MMPKPSQGTPTSYTASEAGTRMKVMFKEFGKPETKIDAILREKFGKSFNELSADGMDTNEIMNALKDELKG